MDIQQQLDELVKNHHVVLFMKGSPQFPQCGFSSRTVEALKACQTDFEHVDVLQQPEVRQNLPQYSQWPTFPQLFINGELVGGCDIVLDLYQRGELKKMLDVSA